MDFRERLHMPRWCIHTLWYAEERETGFTRPGQGELSPENKMIGKAVHRGRRLF